MNAKLVLCLVLVLGGSSIISHADETSVISTNPEAVMSMDAHGVTNNKMVTLEGTNSLTGFAQAAVTNWESFVLSSSNLMSTNPAAALPILAAMMKTNIARLMTNSIAPEVLEAAQFLAELKEQGRLPGVAKDTHGQATVGNVPMSVWAQTPAYPLAVNFNFIPTGESYINHYTVVRFAKGAPWQLVKASQTDTHGHTVKELPVHWIPDFDFIQSKAGTGDVTAQADLGAMYLNGEGVEQDYGKAVKWLRRAADQGDVQSQYNLGVCYEGGKGVPQNYSNAITWYRKAADGHSTRAMVSLGVMYSHGQGVPKDCTNALAWLRKAADAGMPLACNYIGLMHIRGDCVTANTNEAIKWYRKAAEAGSAWAQTELGVRYGKGDGVESNEVEAVKWYQKAAEQSYAQAEANLGNCYLNGWGVATNAEAAVKWLRSAAEQGHPVAERNLGICFGLGEGVKEDPVEAYKWLTLAAQQGAPEAAPLREEFSQHISPEAIAEGFRRAQAFVPQSKVSPDEPQ